SRCRRLGSKEEYSSRRPRRPGASTSGTSLGVTSAPNMSPVRDTFPPKGDARSPSGTLRDEIERGGRGFVTDRAAGAARALGAGEPSLLPRGGASLGATKPGFWPAHTPGVEVAAWGQTLRGLCL